MKKVILFLFVYLCFSSRSGFTQSTGNQFECNLQVDGSIRFQQIDGIGINANTRSWNGKELEPALNILLDSMNATIWRVIVETVEKWEDENDNNDPFAFNWSYYDRLYQTPKFQKAWDMIQYLNDHGITNNLMINFMGYVPAWMGEETVKPEFEDEYVEMLVSFFYYARQKRHLKFGLVSPTNESDWRKEGPKLDAKHYASIMHKLIDRMNAMGMGDVRYVGPDPADMKRGIKEYIPELMKDPVIMAKLAHFGVHSYSGYFTGIDSALKNSPYPKSDYWVTEWNAWRDGLDDGKIGEYNYEFASQSVYYLLDLLKHGATAALEWEGYDSYYEHHAPSLFSYWGILGYDPVTKTYYPRKHLYAIEQVSKFVLPGSWQVAVTAPGDSLLILAFYDTSTHKINIVGINNRVSPVLLNGNLINLPTVSKLEMYHTNSIENLHRDEDIIMMGKAFKTSIPANCIFTLTGSASMGKQTAMVGKKPEPSGWYTGDIHVHKNCGEGTAVLSEDELSTMMEPNDLAVISVLADMGNGEVKYSKEDLPKVNAMDAPQSTSTRIIHWDAEWHWDATYSNFSNQALGGHLVLLGLNEAHQIWDESTYKILEWGKKQNAIRGFCHMQYLNDAIQNELNCCIPVEFPVEAALGSIDFVAEDVYGSGSPNNGNYNSEAAMNAYYKLLNCGFRLGLAAGTDYPCNAYEPLGTLLTYVKIRDNKLTYQKWIGGIKKGNTVVSRNGHNEFIEMVINNKYIPGDEIKFDQKGNISVTVNWTAVKEFTGRIELVQNGVVVAVKSGTVKPGEPVRLVASKAFNKSGWVCARRMDEQGHLLHTAPVYITVNNKPVRASVADAQYFVNWIDNLIANTSPGGIWSRYFTHDLDQVQNRYRKSRAIYKKIATEAQTTSR